MLKPVNEVKAKNEHNYCIFRLNILSSKKVVLYLLHIFTKKTMENITSEEKLIEEIAFPLYASRNWLKLIGILLIVYGGLVAITLIGILVAWLPIWIGIICFQAGRKIELAYKLRDKLSLINAQKNLANFFTIYGILILAGLAIGLMFIVLLISFGIPGNFEELNNYMQNDFY